MQTNSIPQNMLDFIQEHHVLSMATSQNNRPVSCSLFYVFCENEQTFVFASSLKTEHIQNILINPDVSANIHIQTHAIAQIRGIQVKGKVETGDCKDEELYVKVFPYASSIEDKMIWKLKVKELKYTDNSLGFGQKEVWKA